MDIQNSETWLQDFVKMNEKKWIRSQPALWKVLETPPMSEDEIRFKKLQKQGKFIDEEPSDTECDEDFIDEDDDNEFGKDLEINKPIYLQITNVDYYTERGLNGSENIPIIRIIGVNESGNSVMVKVSDFEPYMYIKRGSCTFGGNLNPLGFKRIFNDLIKRHIKDNSSHLTGKNVVNANDQKIYIKRCEFQTGKSCVGFCEKNEEFVKIVCFTPNDMRFIKETLEAKGIETYESTTPFPLRFMIDFNTCGGGWIEVKKCRQIRDIRDKKSRCQIELTTSCSEIRGLDYNDPEWGKIAPLRTLYFDIECSGKEGHFPQAKLGDPVVMISCIVTEFGKSDPVHECLFVADTCDKINGADVYSFRSEKDMLCAWAEYFKLIDIDFLEGWNYENFDLPFIFDRCKELKIDLFKDIGKVKGYRSTMKSHTFSSDQMGTRESKAIPISGIVQMDLMNAIMRKHKFSSYTLNSVALELLNDQKESVHHSTISVLWKKDSTARKKLGIYCLKDSRLCKDINDNQQLTIEVVEMARVAGITMEWVFGRGQQVRVCSQLIRKAKPNGYFVPNPLKKIHFDKYTGGKVITPKRGYYEDPMLGLDFASLYPSIMIANNLCYTTLITLQQIQRSKLTPDDYIKTPAGFYFVKQHIQNGLCSIILRDFLSARKAARAKQKGLDQKSIQWKVLDGRQLGLKISANSLYGFTGATNGALPCLAISSSVTAFGQEYITKVESLVNAKFTLANGYKCNVDVKYGDTDSVLVHCPGYTVEESLKLGQEMADYVNQFFPPPVMIMFEKTYCPYLLLQKKRYIGNLYEAPVWQTPKKICDAKGIEMVRRDNCRYVRSIQKSILDLIMVKRDIPSAISLVRESIQNLLRGTVDISQLVFTASYARSLNEYKVKLAHVVLIKRMIDEDSGSAPRIGDRVSYSFIKKGTKKSKAYDKVESPAKIHKNDLQIDYEYIYWMKIMKPLRSIMKYMMTNSDCEELFEGSHTRSFIGIKIQKSTTGLMKWAVKLETCDCCSGILKSDETFVCSYCLSDKTGLRDHEVKINQELEIAGHKHYECQMECKRCQESGNNNPEDCSNNECDNYYARDVAEKKMKIVESRLQKITALDW